MKKFIIFLTTLLFVTFTLWQISKSRSFQFFGDIYTHINTSEKVIALTFDDGPTHKTNEILAILDELAVKATFYVNGRNLEENIGYAKQLVEKGHDLGNHSYSHERMLLKSYDFIEKEVEETDKLIREAGYTRTITFRPPFGKKLFLLPYYLKRHKRKTVMWNLEPESYEELPQSSDKIVAYVLDNVEPGSIILLHVMYDKREESIKSIKPVVEGLRELGYKFKTISELLDP